MTNLVQNKESGKNKDFRKNKSFDKKQGVWEIKDVGKNKECGKNKEYDLKQGLGHRGTYFPYKLRIRRGIWQKQGVWHKKRRVV